MQNTYHYIREGQPGSELFTFVAKASDLMSFAKIERFNEVEEGVERRLNYSHVLKMVEFMREPDASFAEPILGDLQGNWELDKQNQVLRGNQGAYLLVDDGQHRIASLHLLSPEKREQWEFKVTATMNTPYRERLRRFIQQLKRLKLDTHLVLQIQDRGDLFPDETSEAAYKLGKRLATEHISPLRGLIMLEERVSKSQPERDDAERLQPLLGTVPPAQMLRQRTVDVINISGIMRDLRQIVSSSHSAIYMLNRDQQFHLIVCVLETAWKTWPRQWEDPKQYFLRRSPGISALLELFVLGKTFKTMLDPVFKQAVLEVTPEAKDQIVQVVGYAKGYDWSYQQFRRPEIKFPNPKEIARALDSLIYQNAPVNERKRAEAKRRSRKVSLASR